MHGERVDGNDLTAVREAAGRLLRTARDERRPSVLECLTYRIRGHSVADAGKAYRTKEEIDEWRHRDPIERFGRAAIAAGLLSEDEIAQIRKEVADEISAAIREAAAAPEPDPDAISENVYGDPKTDEQFHGMRVAGPFRRAGGDTFVENVTYREALRRALDEELARDDRVFLMGEEIGRFDGSYKVTQGLWKKYGPKRVRETPIEEEGFVGAGVGAAMLGQRPVVEIMTINFILVAMDMVVNHAAKVRSMFGGKLGVPMVIRTPAGAGAQLTAQHSQSLEVMFAHVPGLKVVAAATPRDAYGMLKSAIRDDDPVLFVENLVLYNTTGTLPEPGEDFTVPLGSARIAREGRDLTIVAHSYTVRRALTVADRLATEGIEIEVVDLRSLRPLDAETVCASVARTSRALIAEEGWSTYGVGAELAARIQRACFDDLDAPVERVGGAEVPMPYAKPLELAALDGEDKIEAAARALLAECGLLERARCRWPSRFRCRASPTRWSGGRSRAGPRRRATRSPRGTCSPTSRPTRRRWSSRATRPASCSRSSCRRASRPSSGRRSRWSVRLARSSMFPPLRMAMLRPRRATKSPRPPLHRPRLPQSPSGRPGSSNVSPPPARTICERARSRVAWPGADAGLDLRPLAGRGRARTGGSSRSTSSASRRRA